MFADELELAEQKPKRHDESNGAEPSVKNGEFYLHMFIVSQLDKKAYLVNR